MKRREVCKWGLAMASGGPAGAWAGSAEGAGDAGGGALAQRWRALSRFGYGPGLAQAEQGGRAWALQQLQAATLAARQPAQVPAPWSGFDRPLPDLFEHFREEREQRRRGEVTTEPPFGREVARQAAAWRVVASTRADLEPPLLARMTEFWFNHLNVSALKGSARPFVGHYVVHAIRPHALGRFEDLLLASARHPAMLFYLDQALSVADGSPRRPDAAGSAVAVRTRGLNENHARELMELHTLGVAGGYTQADITALARILTGWTVDPRSDSGFRFAQRLHDSGDKILLGQTVASQGEREGEDAIRRLARHPATAQRIALRLGQWFVADDPSPALVRRLAQHFLATQGDMQAVMQALMEAPETWAPESRLFKTPFDFVCSALCLTRTPLEDERAIQPVLGFLANAGQPVHAWPTPDGYKVDKATWLSPEALSRRADFAVQLGRRQSGATAWDTWLSPETRQRIAQEPVAMRAGLALASPDFMWK